VDLVETRHGKAAYDASGAGNPVIMFHGGGADRHDYDGLRALLPDRFRTIAVDWPGHGDSPAFEGTATAPALAEVAEDVVSRLAPSGAVLIGNSVGGFAAARLAARRPELTRGLVVLDGGGFSGFGPEVLVFCGLMRQRWFLRAAYPAFLGLALHSRSQAARRARDQGRRMVGSDDGADILTSLWRSFARPDHDLRAEAAGITAPALLIWGRHDPVIPLRVGRKAAALVPGSELVVLDTGHTPHIAEPSSVAAAVIPFADTAFGSGPAAPPAAADAARPQTAGDCHPG
jgi:pimeloyl-ACP methyl ester carboxylesterase